MLKEHIIISGFFITGELSTIRNTASDLNRKTFWELAPNGGQWRGRMFKVVACWSSFRWHRRLEKHVLSHVEGSVSLLPDTWLKTFLESRWCRLKQVPVWHYLEHSPRPPTVRRELKNKFPVQITRGVSAELHAAHNIRVRVRDVQICDFDQLLFLIFSGGKDP